MLDFEWNHFDIIARGTVEFESEDTLKTSFNKCIKIFPKLFEKNWSSIKKNNYVNIKFKKKIEELRDGSEKGDFMNFLNKGYDTLVSKIQKEWLDYNKTKN